MEIYLCTGCQCKYTKPPKSPNNIVVQYNKLQSCVAGGLQQSQFGNAYYHSCTSCICSKWPVFQAHHLQVPDEIISLQHKEVLRVNLG